MGLFGNNLISVVCDVKLIESINNLFVNLRLKMYICAYFFFLLISNIKNKIHRGVMKDTMKFQIDFTNRNIFVQITLTISIYLFLKRKKAICEEEKKKDPSNKKRQWRKKNMSTLKVEHSVWSLKILCLHKLLSHSFKWRCVEFVTHYFENAAWVHFLFVKNQHHYFIWYLK